MIYGHLNPVGHSLTRYCVNYSNYNMTSYSEWLFFSMTWQVQVLLLKDFFIDVPLVTTLCLLPDGIWQHAMQLHRVHHSENSTCCIPKRRKQPQGTVVIGGNRESQADWERV